MNFLWDVIGESSALHILHRRLHKTFAINCMFFFGHTFNFIQLHSTDFIMNQNKSKQTIQAFNIAVTLGFKWYPCCAECFPELFWTKWNDTHGKLLQNGR